METLQNTLDIQKFEAGNFKLLQTIMDLLPNAMSIKNSKLERIAVNQAFVDLSGYSKERLLGQSKLDIQSSETKTAVDYDAQVLNSKKCNKHIEKILQKNGGSIWVEIQKSHFQSETGEDHVVSILTDVTQLKKREFELRASKDRANQRTSQRSRFLANMGHDIRAPLNGIISMKRLLEKSNLDPQQTEAVELLGRSGDSLLRIIDDIIDFAKIDAGVMKIDQSSFNLRDLIEELSGVLGMSARDNQIDLIVSISPTLPENLIGDTVRLRQIMMNLIDNALKFTSEGYVSLDVNGHVQDNIAKLIFTVKDTGIGMPSKKLESLFNSAESDEDDKRVSGISGLGVSLCQKLAKLMGGKLEADSIEGIGSEFKLILPLRVSEDVSTQKIDHLRDLLRSSHNVLTQKILFVDDIKENYDAVLPLLSAHGLTADYAQSAVNAVQMLNYAAQTAAPYTLIFIDYLMPLTDGLLLTVSLRDSQNYANSKIVTLSSVNDTEIRECFLSHNVLDYITKPIRKSDIDELLMKTTHQNFQRAS